MVDSETMTWSVHCNHPSQFTDRLPASISKLFFVLHGSPGTALHCYGQARYGLKSMDVNEVYYSQPGVAAGT